MGGLQIDNLTVEYAGTPVIRDITLEVADGEIFSILGPSGTGKTTILKAIAGLLQEVSGDILINGSRVNHLPPEKRDTVLIFQKPLLFPHLDVAENIGFGLRMQKSDKKKSQEAIEKIASITGLTGLEHRKIHQLSGGQQQRVALARGLVLEPSILLLDEPLSNLDSGLRRQMRELLVEIRHKTGTTMLFVTHDQSEALAISDRICVLLDGIPRQTGTPKELFFQPADPDVALFFGSCNILEGMIENGRFCCPFLEVATDRADTAFARAVIRPEDLRTTEVDTNHSLTAVVERVLFEGTTTIVELNVGNQRLTLRTMERNHEPGQRIQIELPPEKIHIFP